MTHIKQGTLLLIAATFALVAAAMIAWSARVSAAIISDGTWTQSAAPGTTTITYETNTAITAGDKIILTFPDEAVVDVAGTDLNMTSQVAPTRTNNSTTNTITIVTDVPVASGTSVTITMTDALTSYDTSAYIQQSVSISLTSNADAGIDSGLAMIINDNTTTVSAVVPFSLTLSVDDFTMDLGVLNVNAINTATQRYNLGTNNPTGATIVWQSDTNNLRDGLGNDINEVADGAVTAGSEEYGVSLVTSANMNLVAPFDSGDVPLPNTTQTFANTGGVPMALGTIDVTYKASMDAATTPGAYTDILTVTSIANP